MIRYKLGATLRSVCHVPPREGFGSAPGRDLGEELWGATLLGSGKSPGPVPWQARVHVAGSEREKAAAQPELLPRCVMSMVALSWAGHTAQLSKAAPGHTCG